MTKKPEVKTPTPLELLIKAWRGMKACQLQIDAEVDRQYHTALYEIHNFKNYIVRIIPNNGGADVYGMIHPTEPISLAGDVLRLNMLHFNEKKHLIEQRRRVVPVADILGIELLGKFEFDTIQLIR